MNAVRYLTVVNELADEKKLTLIGCSLEMITCGIDFLAPVCKFHSHLHTVPT